MTMTTAHRTIGIEAVGRPESRATSPAPGVPRWARRAAVLAVLTTVPSALWRIAMAVGIPVGASEEMVAEHYGFPSWGLAYVIGLSLLVVGLASLTLGLVQRWGEVAPGWMPVIGGRRVPPMAAVVPAVVGAVLLTLLWVTAIGNFGLIADEYGLEGMEQVAVLACYLPLLLWGPLLAAVTVAYHRRRRVSG